jgi:hypothetical protein
VGRLRRISLVGGLGPEASLFAPTFC